MVTNKKIIFRQIKANKGLPNKIKGFISLRGENFFKNVTPSK
jgi:hypothetical protein